MSDALAAITLRHNETDYEIHQKNANGYDMLNCTRIWEMDGKQKSHKFNAYALTEAGQNFIIERFRELNAHDASKVYATETLTFTLNKPLPAWVTDGLIETKQGRGGGTWAEKRIALHYASWCSVKLASVMIEAFERFGGAVVAHRKGEYEKSIVLAEKAAEGMVREQMKQEAADEGLDDRKVQARKKSVIARNELTALIQAKKLETSLSYFAISDAVNLAIFGHRAMDLRKGLELAEKKSPRPYASADCSLAFALVEGMLLNAIAFDRCKTMTDVDKLLDRAKDSIRATANAYGDVPEVLARKDRAWELEAGAASASLKVKQLTHEK